MTNLKYKLSASLSDEYHWTVVNTPKQVLEIIENWMSMEHYEGEGFSVVMINMTDEELASLPEL